MNDCKRHVCESVAEGPPGWLNCVRVHVETVVCEGNVTVTLRGLDAASLPERDAEDAAVAAAKASGGVAQVYWFPNGIGRIATWADPRTQRIARLAVYPSRAEPGSDAANASASHRGPVAPPDPVIIGQEDTEQLEWADVEGDDADGAYERTLWALRTVLDTCGDGRTYVRAVQVAYLAPDKTTRLNTLPAVVEDDEAVVPDNTTEEDDSSSGDNNNNNNGNGDDELNEEEEGVPPPRPLPPPLPPSPPVEPTTTRHKFVPASRVERSRLDDKTKRNSKGRQENGESFLQDAYYYREDDDDDDESSSTSSSSSSSSDDDEYSDGPRSRSRKSTNGKKKKKKNLRRSRRRRDQRRDVENGECVPCNGGRADLKSGSRGQLQKKRDASDDDESSGSGSTLLFALLGLGIFYYFYQRNKRNEEAAAAAASYSIARPQPQQQQQFLAPGGAAVVTTAPLAGVVTTRPLSTGGYAPIATSSYVSSRVEGQPRRLPPPGGLRAGWSVAPASVSWNEPIAHYSLPPEFQDY